MKQIPVHAELIKLWADGAEIQWFNPDLPCASHRWEDCNNNLPTWNPKFLYRVKPEPKPDIVKYMYVDYQKHTAIAREKESYHNVKFVFDMNTDGSMGKLKSAEVI